LEALVDAAELRRSSLSDAPKKDPPAPAAPTPYPESLCHACAARRYVPARASTFLMCTALDVKYPRQPVRACVAFRPLAGA
jgi:hypothetical protein